MPVATKCRTAFIAETAKGKEGAALDALVLERLLQWLGTARRDHLGLRARQLLREPLDRRARR